MPYLSRTDERVQRGGKIAADIACGLLLLTFSIVFFGFVGGVIAFVILETALIGVDFLMPAQDDATGVVR